MYWLGWTGSKQNLSMSCMRCIIYHVRSLKLFNGLCSHYPVSVFLPCLLRVPPNGGTNRFIWDRNYNIFKQWVHPSDSKGRQRESQLIQVYLPSGHERREERTVQSGSVRLPNKLVCHLSPLWSCFLFLSASCLGGDWWGLWKSWVACQSCRARIFLLGWPVQAQFPPP